YVAEAKRQVSGIVGIDGLTGPSELFAIADALADPGWLVLDLAAQAEHGPDSPLVLASPEPGLLDAVAEAAEKLWTERASVAAALAPTVEALARSEGFPVHGESAAARSGENG